MIIFCCFQREWACSFHTFLCSHGKCVKVKRMKCYMEKHNSGSEWWNSVDILPHWTRREDYKHLFWNDFLLMFTAPLSPNRQTDTKRLNLANGNLISPGLCPLSFPSSLSHTFSPSMLKTRLIQSAHWHFYQYAPGGKENITLQRCTFLMFPTGLHFFSSTKAERHGRKRERLHYAHCAPTPWVHECIRQAEMWGIFFSSFLLTGQKLLWKRGKSNKL